MKINVIRKLLILIIVTLSVFLSIFLPYIIFRQENVLQTNIPMRLEIKSIGVDSLIEHVGTTTSGEMGTPKFLEDVAWFSLGTYPGQIGTAVIAGHSGWVDGKDAAFDRLFKVKIGEIITIKNENGVAINFVVRSIRRYSPFENSTAVFTSNDMKSHLNLITCNGTWDAEKKNYKERLVVFTDKEME